MKVRYIHFKRRFFFWRHVEVGLSSGGVYKIRRAGAMAVVVPPCENGEREALGVVYKAVWEWLNGEDGEGLDRGAKIACGRLVKLLEWPPEFTDDIQTRLEYIVNKVTYHENIF